MQLAARFLIYAVCLVAINVTTRLVLVSNLEHGVYPPEADSIGIPLASAMVLSIYVGIGLLLAAIFPFAVIEISSREPTGIHAAMIAIVLMIHAALIVMFFLWAASWMDENHWPIAALCTLTALCLSIFCYIDVRRLHKARRSA